MKFDIVIPVGPNDINFIDNTLVLNQQNILNYRKIFIVTNISLITNINKFNNCILIDENSFPFNISTIKQYLGNNDRCGWYFQQLIKLYSVLLKITSVFHNLERLLNSGHIIEDIFSYCLQRSNISCL